MSEPKEDVKLQELINSHWEYIEGLLKAHNEGPLIISKIFFHYTTAFAHGYKHAKEEANK